MPRDASAFQPEGGPPVDVPPRALTEVIAAGSRFVRIVTLKKRSEFQRVRGGGRCALPAFVLEGKRRADPDTFQGPRFGFTITRKIGNAVVRNRIRRRLKSALSQAMDEAADPHFDYVVVARHQSYDRPFSDLLHDVSKALRQVSVHRPQRR